MFGINSYNLYLAAKYDIVKTHNVIPKIDKFPL